MTSQSESNARGWIVAAAAMGINLVMGLLYAWSVVGKALVINWGWTREQAVWPFAVATASFAVTMIFAGRMQDKIGPRFVALLGGLTWGAALIASGCVQSLPLMVLTFGVIGGVGIGLGYSSTTPPAIKWFPPARKGLITGLVVSGVGLAAVYASPLTQYLLKTRGISQTFLFLGAGAVIVVGILSQFLNNPPAGHVAAPAGKAGAARRAAVSGRDLDWHEMLKTGQFYRLWIVFILAAWAGLMIIAHVATIAKEQARWEWGFVPLVLLAIFNTAGRVVSGFVSDRIGRTQTMILAFVLQAINMFAFHYYTSPALLVFGSAMTGLCYGTIFTLMPAATADFYGVRNLGVNYGLVFTGFGVAGVFGPIVGGRVRDVTGSYTASYLIAAVLLLIGAALAFTTRAPRAVAEQMEPDRIREEPAGRR